MTRKQAGARKIIVESKDLIRKKFVEHYCSGSHFGNRGRSYLQALADLGIRQSEGDKPMSLPAASSCGRALLCEVETQQMIVAFREQLMESEEHLILSSREALHRLSQIAMGSLEGYEWKTEKGKLKKVPIVPSFAEQRAALDTILKWWSLGETEEARTIAEFNRLWDEGLVHLTPDLRDIIAGERDAKKLARRLMPYVDQIKHEMKEKRLTEQHQEGEQAN